MLLPRLFASLWFSRFRQKVIGPYASHVLVESFNGKLLVPKSDFTIGSLAFRGEYDRKHVEELLRLTSVGASVLFVGAHIGTLVVPISRVAKEIVAIEAIPQTFETLQMNLLLNGCRNVRALNLAASDKVETIQMQICPHNTGGSKITPARSRPEFQYDKLIPVSVPVARLDDLLPDFRPSLIIMDIEGAEAKALRGMPRLLASCNTLLVEFIPDHIENVAGISCADFLRLLPFPRIRLMDAPDEEDVLSCARQRFYHGGADLLCTR